MSRGIDSETPLNAHRVFAGLAPTQQPAAASRENRISRSLLNTVPIVLVGSVAAVSMNLTAPVESTPQKPRHDTVKAASQLGKQIKQALVSAGIKTEPTSVSTAAFAAAQAAPSTYHVAAGDTVSGIAGRFGLSTASVLALNGLGWKSIIFPGQVLKLTNGAAPSGQAAPKVSAPAASNRYTIVKGDTISGIAARFGLSTQTLLSANGLGWSSIIYPGQTLAIPGTAPAAAPAPVIERVSSTTPTTAGSHTIKRGDTLSSIAKQYGLTLSALLQANSLSMTSVIYAGRTLSIPGSSPAPVAGSVVALTDEMRENARTIVQVGKDLGVPEYGIVIALATAAQESSMRNINYGDRDSLGLFQQRPSAGWGTPDQIMNPAHAARLFYGGPSNPNKGVTRGLLEINGWQSMTLTQAAQAVQISAYPDAYAKWEKSARAWYDQLR